MNKILLFLALIITANVSACAQTEEETSIDPLKKTPMTEADKAAEQKTFWVKKPGTPVYNSGHKIIRSLRLQPTVSVHKVVDGWGLINLHKDEWVNMSDLTETQPERMLAGPQESTELPRVNLDEFKDSNGNKP